MTNRASNKKTALNLKKCAKYGQKQCIPMVQTRKQKKEWVGSGGSLFFFQHLAINMLK